MSDQFDALFAEVRGVQPPTAFAPPEQVRRRGRQRTHRKALAAAAGVLAVTAVAAVLGAGGALPRPDVPPPPADTTPTNPTATSPTTASPTPSRTSPPAPTPKAGGVLLQPGELGPGEWRRFEAEQLQGAGRWYWELWDGTCPGYKSNLFPSLRHQDDVETVAYRAVGATGEDMSVSQIVERYENGWGEDNLTDVRAVIDRCGDAEPTAEMPTVPRFAIVENGFAGDESLLVRQDLRQLGQSAAPDPQINYIAVVRVGDNVTTVRPYPADADRARSLAERAAARLG